MCFHFLKRNEYHFIYFIKCTFNLHSFLHTLDSPYHSHMVPLLAYAYTVSLNSILTAFLLVSFFSCKFTFTFFPHQSQMFLCHSVYSNPNTPKPYTLITESMPLCVACIDSGTWKTVRINIVFGWIEWIYFERNGREITNYSKERSERAIKRQITRTS